MTPSPRVRCRACGTEQVATDDGCEICGAALPGGHPQPGPEEEGSEIFDLDAPSAQSPSPPVPRATSHAPQIAELAEAPSVAAAETFEELVQLDKRIETLRSLVPIWGPIALWRSDLHGDGEKLGWTAVSVLLTVALAIGLISLLPSRAERAAEAHRRVDTDLANLASLIERFREDSGSYPDADAWARSIERGDARFIDPWGRAYEYRLEAMEFVLETRGEDGKPGGSTEAADVVRRFPIASLP